jgi:DinB superfamily
VPADGLDRAGPSVDAGRMAEPGIRGGATTVAEVVYLLDEAFAGPGIEASNEAQSLLQNLASVSEEQWREIPNGGVRTVESIALHVGTCKIMYDEYAFGRGERRWDDPDLTPWPEGHAPMHETVEWLKASHARLVDHVRCLRDADLGVPRRANWGELRPTRWLISTILQHDAYHAGEINHIRSLLAGDDRWHWS